MKTPSISGQRAATVFSQKFPRVKVNLRKFVPIKKELLSEDFKDISGFEFLGLKDFPTETHRYASPELNLRAIIPDLNQVILYRALRKAYGVHDVPIVMTADRKSLIPASWSFVLSVRPEVVAVIQSRVSRISVAFHSVVPGMPDGAKTALTEFLDALPLFHKGCEGLFDEGAFKANVGTLVAIPNMFLEKFQGACTLMNLADDAETRSKLDTWKLDAILAGTFEADSPQILRFSSAVMFFVSLEALINVVYECLARDGIRSNSIVRDLARKDFQVRIAAMHILCDGFDRNPFPVDSPLMERLKDHQEWRNKVLHAAVTDDLCVMSAIEDGAQLYYYPQSDNRGTTGNRARKGGPARSQAHFTVGQIEEIKALVTDVRSAIVESLSTDVSARFDAMMRDRIVGRAMLFPGSD